MQLGFSFDADACTGCKACVVACKDVNNLPVGYKLRRVVTAEAGGWEPDVASGLLQPVGVFSYSVSYACMHCDAPACLAHCPKGAISKDAETGIVVIDQELCIGCGTCARVCPWGAPVVVPRIDGTRRARKCDLCRELLAAGEEPACVAACAMRCLKLAEFPGAGALGAAGDAGLADAAGFGEPLLADAPELGPHLAFSPHRGRLANPGASVRIHSMPEEYANV
jgi:anaerobic dimethyl sulfoxide reductase subunit B (iron-sulfur subunit)